MNASRLSLHEPLFAGNEWRYLKECLDSGWVSTGGSFVGRFERMVSERLGVKHAVAMVNGTAALHLALQSCGVERGDEVLVPTLTFIATANAVSYLGAKPRFADAEEATYGMDPDQVESWLKARTEPAGGARRHRASGRRIAACVPVHIFGFPARLDKLKEVCARFKVPLVEDAAESLGTLYKGRPAGTFGRAAALSFNGNKILTTGGGGMVVTNDDRVAKSCRHLSTQAKSDPAAYLHDAVGYNYRMPSLNAALGCAQMEQLDSHLAKKRRLAGWYAESLAGVKGLTIVAEPENARSNFWLVTARADTERRAIELRRRLEKIGVESRAPWTPCHLQGLFAPLAAGRLEVAERLWRTSFNLPSSASLGRKDVARVAGALAA